MNIDFNEGYNLVYAKKGGSPKNMFFGEKNQLIGFLIENIINIDFISINDVTIDIDALIKNNENLFKK